MQPFGLLNFLKLAMQASEPNTSPSMTAQPPVQAEEMAPTPSQKNEDGKKESPAFSPQEDAYCAFVERHERTARKIRQEKR